MSEEKEVLWRKLGREESSEHAIWCNNLCCWFGPYTSPAVYWPPPRYDDPAKCGDPERMILEWSYGAGGSSYGAGGSSYWGERAKAWTQGRAWLEQPPGPIPQKSEAEIAWEQCDRKDYTPKEAFVFGFNHGIAKGAK